ncbi:hypothetical protein FNW02_33285 [Komarekiella sp. 'clone 1']|uniref:Uncharacterized protein n=1 Tax=Komarekiella delphini-convector SJRDD-AB1 TaxID=2593771 RepID=A0AA40T3Z5_9NOST|nr:hypothetical protein [Komarekiella delphini-convector]MBD6620523.1 hypothetical protein [Komarekiella delphini-convector SJRDD-AB1]
MWLSTRAIGSLEDDKWAGEVGYYGLSHLREIRSIDSWCNPHVDYSQNFQLDSLEQAWDLLDWLPIAVSGQQYHLLFAKGAQQNIPLDHPRLKLLGYDLSDAKWKSPLWNYLSWRGVLAPLVRRRNQYGLLTWKDATTAQEMLPEAWYYDPRSFVKIWALFEVLPVD